MKTLARRTKEDIRVYELVTIGNRSDTERSKRLAIYTTVKTAVEINLISDVNKKDLHKWFVITKDFNHTICDTSKEVFQFIKTCYPDIK